MRKPTFAAAVLLSAAPAFAGVHLENRFVTLEIGDDATITQLTAKDTGAALAATASFGDTADSIVRHSEVTEIPSSWAIKELGGKNFRAVFPSDIINGYGGWDKLPDTVAYREAVMGYQRIMGVSDYAICRHSALFKTNPNAKVGLPYAERQKPPKPYTLDHFFYLDWFRNPDGSMRDISDNAKSLRDSFRTLVERRPDNMFTVAFHDVRPLNFLISDDFGADAASFPAWRAAHPQFAWFSTFVETDNEFNGYVRKCEEKPRHPIIEEGLKRYPLTDDRHRDMTNFLQTAYNQARKLYFGSDELSGLYSLNNVFGHQYGRLGVKTLVYEAAMNATSGPWAWSGAFMRGAGRQWNCRTAWYVAHCFDTQPDDTRSWTRDGKPSGGECYWPNRKRKLGTPRSEPYRGSSRSLLRRGYFYGWTSGCTTVQVENPVYFFIEDAPDGGFQESPYAKDFDLVFDLNKKVDRGVPYVPIAMLTSLRESVTRFCYPVGCKDPLPVSAFLFTLIPTLRENPMLLSDRKKGDIGCLWNSEFGEIWDSLVPDGGQDSDKFLKALSAYKAAFLVGAFDDKLFDRQAIDRYVRGGGTLFVSIDNVRNGLVSIPDGPRRAVLKDDDGKPLAEAIDCGNGRYVVVNAEGYLTGEALAKRGAKPDSLWPKFQAEISSGRVTFPVVKKLLAKVQDETIPFKVEGDVQWGVNQTKKGWFLWFINNKGSTKFAKEPETIDHSFDQKVRVTDRRTGKVHEVAVAAADYAYLELGN